jgi:DNA-binding IclR family transcriptional regulator
VSCRARVRIHVSRTSNKASEASGSDSGAPERQHSQSLERGLAILRCFTAERPSLGIAELADLLDNSRSTTHRYSTTLVQLGYLEQDASRKYHLGTQAAEPALAVIGAMPIQQHARPLLEDLRLTANFTVILGVFDEDRVLCLDVLHGSRSGQYAIDAGVAVGSSAALHCTAIGKALLAHLPDGEQDTLLAHLKLSKHGPNTVGSKKALREQLSVARADGLAVDDEESVADIQGIAVPVIADDGELFGGIGLLAPRTASTVQELRSSHGASLLDAAGALAGLLA